MENAGADKVYIFFTSHGLFFPTTIDEFRSRVVNRNFYEWVGMIDAKETDKLGAECIFVRDIYKNWCLYGVSAKINTIDKLCARLKELAGDRPIVTVGSSAGGYMAILFGSLLGAEAIYAFSPQVDLHKYNERHPIKYYGEMCGNENIAKYMKLRPYIENYNGRLYWFYPTGCPEDREQYDSVSDIEKIMFFAMKWKEHGMPMYRASTLSILNMSFEELDGLYRIYAGKEISAAGMLFRTDGFVKGVFGILYGKFRIAGSMVKKKIKLIRKKIRR